MNPKIEKYDLIVIGGGAAGIMAAISAKIHHPKFNVIDNRSDICTR